MTAAKEIVIKVNPQQLATILQALQAAKETDKRIADFTGEAAEEIAERYDFVDWQLPSPYNKHA